MAGPVTPVGIVAVGAGVVLVYSGVTGQSPLGELRKALASGRLDGTEGNRPISSAVSLDFTSSAGNGDPGTGIEAGPPAPGTPTGSPSPTRVRFGKGNHTLSPAASSAFRAAEQALGLAIPISGASRSYAEQAANYASNPNRYGPPDGNAHVEGRAVDIDLAALGAYPQGEPPQWMSNAAYARLARAMMSAGWCNYQLKNGTANGRTREPWHWSIGRCN